LQAGTGPYFGMIAADLQEPPDLLVRFLTHLVTDKSDIVVGSRITREDPHVSKMWASLFWRLYRTFVLPEIPIGGVDLFACNEQVRNELLKLEEANTSLIGLVFWLGFNRMEVAYVREARRHGKSTWTFRKKLNYLADSVFAFTDLPIRLLTISGVLGIVLSMTLGMLVLIAHWLGQIPTPGYAATILTIMFFGALNTVGIGIVGSYVWRSYENSKRRPLGIVQKLQTFEGRAHSPVDRVE
jgi:polyisoprenyl-phosphate glycosyltransferase